MKKILLIIFTMMIPIIHGILFDAYNCEDSNVNQTSISLHSIKECPLLRGKDKISTERVTIFSKNTVEKIIVKKCKVVKHSITAKCGMFSHNMLLPNSMKINENVKISAEDCLLLHQRNVYIPRKDKVIDDLMPDRENLATISELGQVSYDGNCKGTDAYIDNVYIEDVIRLADYEIYYEAIQMTLDRDRMKILDGNNEINYNKGYYVGDKYTYIWDTDHELTSCGINQYTTIHYGIANITTTDELIDIVMVSTVDFTFALITKHLDNQCGLAMYSTNHPNIYVIKESMGIYTISNKMFKAREPEINLNLIINLKIFYVEHNIKHRMRDLYWTIIEDLCKTMLTQLNTLLSIARISPEEFAWAYTGKPGYTAIVRGEVAYLLQCVKVPVVVRDVDKCYNEIPILFGNKSMFAKPTSRIITRFATPIPCMSLMPHLFYVNGNWIKISGEPYIPSAPQQLTANPTKLWEYGELVADKKVNYISQKAMDDYLKSIMIPIERESVKQIFANKLLNNIDDQFEQLENSLLSPRYIEKLTDSVMDSIYGFFSWVFKYLGVFFGLSLLLDFIMRIIHGIMNVIILYNRFGFGWHLALAFWTTLVHHVCDDTTREALQNGFRRRVVRQAEGDIAINQQNPNGLNQPHVNNVNNPVNYNILLDNVRPR